MTAHTRDTLTPLQLNTLAKDLLETGLGNVWVEGEISGLAKPASGHVYFSLKDDRAQVRCAMFRHQASRVRFALENGTQVLARAKASLYEARGDYQLIVSSLEPAGAGALQRAFEALKKKLADEGLFEAERKLSLPSTIQRLGVITSATGAAIQDVLSVLKRRWPLMRVDVLPVLVQGASAPAEIIIQLNQAVQSGRYDCLLITRGGGSPEDLAAFNNEALARTIADADVPIVSAIGHEVDFTICDFVADARAPTPSAAAELLSPNQADMRATLANHWRRINTHVQWQMQARAQRLDRLQLRLMQQAPQARWQRHRERMVRLHARLQQAAQRTQQNQRQHLAMVALTLRQHHPKHSLSSNQQALKPLRNKLHQAFQQQWASKQQQASSTARALHAVSPLATVQRGYAVLEDADSSTPITSVHEAKATQNIHAKLRDGSLSMTVADVMPNDQPS